MGGVLGGCAGEGEGGDGFGVAGENGGADGRGCGGEVPQARVVVFAGSGEPGARPVVVEGEDGVGVPAQEVDVFEGFGGDDADVFGVGGDGKVGGSGRQEAEVNDFVVVGGEVVGCGEGVGMRGGEVEGVGLDCVVVVDGY